MFLAVGLLLTACIYSGFKYAEIKGVSENSDGLDDLISLGFTTNLDAYLQLSGL